MSTAMDPGGKSGGGDGTAPVVVDPATAARQDVLVSIFGENVGDLVKNYSCAVESKVLMHGRMYVTNRGIYFYSNVFGVEKKLRIPYSHVNSISKAKTVLVIPNAIVVSTDKGDFVFRSFWVRDKCFHTLSSQLEAFRKSHSDHSTRDAAASHH